MKKDVVVLIAEDDEGHATLIIRNLKRAGILNEILHFKDGEQTLDFLFQRGAKPHRERNTPYVLLLDIRMPKVDGEEVLREVKQDQELCKMPVIMITTTDDPREVENCHRIGCSNYIAKPVNYEKFIEAMRNLGLFLMIVEVPQVNGSKED